MRSTKSLARIALAVLFALPAMSGTLAAQTTLPQGSPFDPKTGHFAASMPNEARPADTLAATRAKAWEALNAVYSQLGLALTIVDTGSHVIGAVRVTQRHPVAGERLSRILECGTGQYGPNAERYTVQITVVSAVGPVGEKQTSLATRVGGTAAPNGLNSSVNCASTGVLEEKILDLMRKTLGP